MSESVGKGWRRGLTAGLASAVLVLLGSACADEEIAGPVRACMVNDNCAADEICFLTRCVPKDYRVSNAYLDVDPPTYSGLLRQPDPVSLQYSEGRPVDGGGAVEIRLHEPRLLRGTILANGADARTGYVSAVVERQENECKVESLLLVHEAGVDTAGFAMQLQPRTYNLAFFPDPGDIPRPPVYRDAFQHDGANEWVEDNYPPDVAIDHITGNLYWESGSTLLAVDNVSVVAVDPMDINRQRSTADYTAQSTGDFSLYFRDLAAKPLMVRVSSADNPDVPTTLFSGAVFADVRSGSHVDLFLGVAAAQQLNTLLVVDQLGAGVPGVTLDFRGYLSGESLHRPGRVSTDEWGRMAQTLNFYEGSYEVVATPPSNQACQYAVTRARLCVDSSPDLPAGCLAGDPSMISDVEITLNPAAQIDGRVISFGGRSVPNARVFFTPVGRSDLSPIQGTTDSRGEYHLCVTPQAAGDPEMVEYLVRVEPRSPLVGDEIVPSHLQIVRLGTDSQLRFDIQLHAATLIHGKVFNQRGQALENAVVTFYSTALPLATCDEPLRIGAVPTNSRGEFNFAMPTVSPQ